METSCDSEHLLQLRIRVYLKAELDIFILDLGNTISTQGALTERSELANVLSYLAITRANTSLFE